MSKDRKKLLHIHSSVNDKQPTPATLEIGELGVNNAKGNAFISTKNSNGEVVRFSEDETIIGWMEQKEVFPYEGYVRGSDNSQVGGVTEQDLVNNKSNIIIKLNQVVPENTDYSPYDEKVNGAKDIYGNLINPISSGSYKDGAGLAIDMSNYAMQGANPSFSSITTTCHATLNGTTEIKGKGDGCGSKFTVEVANACIDASDTLNEYGVNKSNFGTSCDGAKISNDTTLKGKKVLIESPSGDLTVDIKACSHISGSTNDFVIRECQDNEGKVEIDTTEINVSASTINAQSCDLVDIKSNSIVLEGCEGGNGQITIDTDDLCLVGSDKINVYGKETNVGIDCNNEDPQVAINTNIVGNNVSITANNNGGITIGGNGTYPITYTRRVREENCPITSTTVDDALKEVFNRSKIGITQDGNTFTLYQDSGDCKTSVDFTIKETTVSMSADTPSAESEVAKTYTLWQTINGVRSDIGTIDIPKDHLLKDASVVYGIWDGTTWTECQESASEDCHWYIKMVYNVFDPSSGHPDDAVIYLPVDGFIKDITSANTDSNRGVNVNVWYDGKQNLVSADTAIHFDTPNDTNEFTYGKRDGEHWISGTTVAFNSGSFSATTYKPWSASTTVNIPTEVSHLNRGKLTYSHNGFSGEYDPASGSTFTSPHSALTINYGATSGKSGSVTFDTSNAASISVPTSVNHLNRGEFTVEHNNDRVTYDPATSTSITLSHETLTATYGATSGKSGSVTFDTSEDKEIVIPTEIDHLNRGKLTVTHNGFSGTYDPATDGSMTLPHSALTVTYEATSGKSGSVTFDTSNVASVSVPTSVNHLDRGKLTYSHNGFSETFDPASDGTFTSPHSALTITYGSTNAVLAENKTYDTSAEQTIIIPKTISDITNGKIVTNWENGCTTLNGGLCTDDVIKATAFYSSSDLSLKENIKSIDINDFNKTNAISFKSFNFKDDEKKTKTYGVIAQDVQSAGLNEIVHKDESGNLSVDYISLLILKIASLEDTIKNLTNEINNLKEAK